jgi:hypothetical protein
MGRAARRLETQTRHSRRSALPRRYEWARWQQCAQLQAHAPPMQLWVRFRRCASCARGRRESAGSSGKDMNVVLQPARGRRAAEAGASAHNGAARPAAVACAHSYCPCCFTAGNVAGVSDSCRGAFARSLQALVRGSVTQLTPPWPPVSPAMALQGRRTVAVTQWHGQRQHAAALATPRHATPLGCRERCRLCTSVLGVGSAQLVEPCHYFGVVLFFRLLSDFSLPSVNAPAP